jgi:Ala-tRNA(Pro) deacylase
MSLMHDSSDGAGTLGIVRTNGTPAREKQGKPGKLAAKCRSGGRYSALGVDRRGRPARVEVVMRVPEFLIDQRVRFERVMHPPSYTAQKLAKQLHVSGKQVAKSVVLAGGDSYFLAVLPAALRVDLAAVSEYLGTPVRLAGEHEVVRLFSDCEWGAVTPFGHLYGLTTILDNSIAPDSMMAFEAGRHAEAIRMMCRDFERLERPRRFVFARAVQTRRPRAS